MGTNSKQLQRLWIGGTVVAGLLVLVIGYFAFIGPERSHTRDLESQVADATLQNTQLRGAVNQLAAESQKLPQYQAELATAQEALPSTSGVPDFLKTLQQIDNTANVSTSVTVGTPTDVTSLSGASPATASSGSTASTLTVGSAHIYALPITAQVTGAVPNLNEFLDQLQSVQPRAVLISDITETAGPSSGPTSGNTSLSLTMQAFVAPSSPTEDAQLAQAASSK